MGLFDNIKNIFVIPDEDEFEEEDCGTGHGFFEFCYCAQPEYLQ